MYMKPEWMKNGEDKVRRQARQMRVKALKVRGYVSEDFEIEVIDVHDLHFYTPSPTEGDRREEH